MKLLPFLILIIACCNSCTRVSRDKDGSTQSDSSKKIMRPEIITRYTGKTDPVVFEAAYFNGTKVKQDSMEFTFHTFEIGKIKIESGKIIACDPIMMHEWVAFTKNFPIGQFPVQLAMAKFDDDERVAYSRIIFSDNAVERWEYALLPGQRPIPLYGTMTYYYGVDAATGIFIDDSANIDFCKKSQAEWESVFFGDDQQNKNGFIHDFDGHNVAVFSTGYGDGSYATFLGLDANGNVCRLLTDFALIDWWSQ